MSTLTTLVLGGIGGALLDRANVVAKWHRHKKRVLLGGKDRSAGDIKSAAEKIKTKATNKTKAVMSDAEADAAHYQKVALGAIGLFGVGAITSPIVALAGLPLLGYSYIRLMRGMHKAYQQRSHLAVVLFDTLSVSFTLFLGYFFITAILFTVLFTTNRLVAKTEREAQTDFSRIFGELSDTVWLLRDEAELKVPLESLQIHDVIVIHAGEMIPVDGHVSTGEGLVDQHLLTGESQPIERKAGDSVLTSTLLVSGTLQVVVDKKGADTVTGQIAKTLEHAATFKDKAQSRGDEIVEKGALRTMLASAAALPLIGVNHAIALSYSGFGYQMRTAAPLTVLNYLRVASRNGIFVKDGRVFDVLHHVDTVIFDKTGTLTEEIPYIERVIACNGFTKDQVLQYAASAEQRQQHPIALAICSHAEEQQIELLEMGNTDYVIGHGLRVELRNAGQNTRNITIGSERFMRQSGISIPESLKNIQQEAGDKGYSIVYVASEDSVLSGAVELRPALRPQANGAVKALHDLGIKLYIISGDQEKPTRYLAEALGIDDYFAETLPTDKAKHVERLQNEGHKVCFIGDGINDSVALQKADVSVSLHGAATIAQDTADVVLMTPDLLHLPYLIKMSAELQKGMNRSELMNTVSGLICVSGIVIFGMGISGAIAMYALGLTANISGAMLPLLEDPDKHKSRNKA